MFVKAKRFIARFFKKSRSIDNKLLNPVSLIVIIIVDIFILSNVFIGLDNISRWHITPSEAYPCVSEWRNYRDDKQADGKDYNLIASALSPKSEQTASNRNSLNNYKDRLGDVSTICLNYAELQDKVNIPAYRSIEQSIDNKQNKVASLEQANVSIRSQYDSTLLEKIAGQKANQSINNVSAEKAKQTLAQNKVSITAFEKEITVLKESLLAKPESIDLIAAIKDDSKYQVLTNEYQHASFWYPSIQLMFQALFLLPLLAIASFIHQLAVKKGAGLVALITWHLLVIFFIPLLLKIFEFLQVGVLLQLLIDIIGKLFGGLLFLVSYLYIFIIPLVGFALIKIFQRFSPTSKIQDVMSMRFQNQLCLNCAKRIRPQDAHCPHCGYDQHVECPSCHQPTYKHLAHCKHCGSLQAPISLSDYLPTGNNP
jgi:ABC-type multidrug transport system fused ATPase/permease subunit